MIQSFYNGNSGLNANKNWLSVISDNIANVNTTGFKQERMNFTDLVASSMTTYSASGAPKNKEIGGGAFVASTIKDFSQGSFKSTNQPLSLALDGEGFFMVKNPSNPDLTYYTRAGDFRIDANGDIINQSGMKLQGWNLDENGNIAGAMDSINIPRSLDPKATTEVAFEHPANLNAEEKKIANTTANSFDTTDTDTYSYVNTITTYDSLGTPHTLKHYFIKRDTNKWEVYTLLDDRAIYYEGNDKKYAAIELSFTGDGLLQSAKYVQSQSIVTSTNVTETNASSGEYFTSNVILPGSVKITSHNGNPVHWNDDGNGNIVDVDTGEIVGKIEYNYEKKDNNNNSQYVGRIIITKDKSKAEQNSISIMYDNTLKDQGGGSNVSDLTKIRTEKISYTNTYSVFLNTGADEKEITENFQKLTQLSSDYIFYAQQNGSSKGDLMNISVTEDGVIKGIYTNGQIKDQARLALATFKDKEILVRKGDSLYIPNQQTFTPIIIPGGAIGKVRSGMLEMSNVDISREFINLITAQRAYQANAKTVTTSDQILQTTMDMKR